MSSNSIPSVAIAGHVDSAADRWLLRLGESVAEYYASRGCIIRVCGRGELAKAVAVGAVVGWMSSPQPPPPAGSAATVVPPAATATPSATPSATSELAVAMEVYSDEAPGKWAEAEGIVWRLGGADQMLVGAAALVWLPSELVSPYILHAAERCGLQIIRVSWG